MFPNTSTSPSSFWWGYIGLISSSSKWTTEKIIDLGLSWRFFDKLNLCCLLETSGSHSLNSYSSYVWNIIIYHKHLRNNIFVLLLPLLSILTSFAFFQCFSLSVNVMLYSSYFLLLHILDSFCDDFFLLWNIFVL